jgi:3-hydroxyisobutyrate dehydrogenase
MTTLNDVAPDVLTGQPVGFIGIGTMGLPLASNLLRAGFVLTVWNRSDAKCDPLVELGARKAATVREVFDRSSIVLVMLLNETAIDAALQRGTGAFERMVRGKTLVNLGTTSPAYSLELETEVVRAGGQYVEAPVSGSRLPAERGALVGMIAGPGPALARVRPLLAPLCSRVFSCGCVPGAMRMKLAVNHYLIAMVAALGEAFQSARAAGVDLQVLREALDAGPMASEVSRTKLDKLLRGDYSPQAAVHDAGKIARLSLAQAQESGALAPLMKRCVLLYEAAEQAGWGSLDMIAATRTLERQA